MKPRALFATALIVAFPVVSPFAADEVAPDRIQETTNPPPITDANITGAESHAVPDNLQAARKVDESPFSDIKILPSF